MVGGNNEKKSGLKLTSEKVRYTTPVVVAQASNS
ncbi:hypothetical protein ZPR_1433 [Zunongwangia profunda SM-A87]|uniref:Uncharacterized protein n=1 Tax=Zunongwangia profunda (strain DSM 18752 / CCTCC AB 206139 / SM-A87) TaxID=655815 RepID=D5BK89_ZUNPS|nr:hypothetical protein ZPR_1433 [Zunongwangia profunda SM-A87]|tara:strand:+ start:2210 stop:2311 length:102 start_codon:yes stop_codon:yes gene_type:complete